MLCDVCNINELSNYCTANVCEECCKSMKCPIRYECDAYPRVLEKIIKKNKERIINEDKIRNDKSVEIDLTEKKPEKRR